MFGKQFKTESSINRRRETVDSSCSGKNSMSCSKDNLKMLMETSDIELQKEHVTKNKPIEYAIEYYLQKTLKEGSQKEVINRVVINIWIQ